MAETTCRAVEPLLSAWLDGELPPAEAETVGQHVRECATCAHDRSRLAAARSLVRSIPVRVMPPAVGLQAARAVRPRQLVATATMLLAVIAGLLGGAAYTLGAQPEPGARTVNVPMDALVADHLVHAVRGAPGAPAAGPGGP